MDAQTLRDCADHMADTISKSIDSIGPIELGPETQTAIILHALISRSPIAITDLDMNRMVERAQEVQTQLRRRR